MLWKARYPSSIAAILAIAAAVSWLLFMSSNNRVLADLLENIGNVRSGVCTGSSGIDGLGQPVASKTKTMFLEPGRVRFERPGSIQITDLRVGKTLLLYPIEKKAELQTRAGSKEYPDARAYPFQMFGPGVLQHATFVRDEVVKGRRAKVYHLAIGKRPPPDGYTIYVDAAAALPIRAELQMKTDSMIQWEKWEDFQWNIDLDESLFSLTPPESYELIDTVKFPAYREPIEEDIAASLKYHAEIEGGIFPQRYVDEDGAMMPNNNWQGVVPGYSRKVLEREVWQRGSALAIQYLQKGEFRYVGKGVKLGEADKIVAWWKATKDARTYRVLYGDLSVKDVKEEDLPK